MLSTSAVPWKSKRHLRLLLTTVRFYLPRRSPRRGLRCPAPSTTLPQASILRREVARSAMPSNRRERELKKASLSRLTRPVHPMPAFVLKALKARKLLDAYRSRPAYQQNDYVG